MVRHRYHRVVLLVVLVGHTDWRYLVALSWHGGVLVNRHRRLWHPLGHHTSVDILLQHHRVLVIVDCGARVCLLARVVRHMNHRVVLALVVLEGHTDWRFLVALS